MVFRAIPWMTDDAVRFMFLFCDWFEETNGFKPSILELGMGASTMFFVGRSKKVTSLEHDPDWYSRVVKCLDASDEQHLRAHCVGRPYSEKLNHLVGDEKFDLVSIDGRDRVACLREVLKLGLVAKNGVLVIDNTERISKQNGKYATMVDLLRDDFNIVHFEQIGRDRAG